MTAKAVNETNKIELLETKVMLQEVLQIARQQEREIAILKKRLVDSQARTKELYLALRKVVTKDHPALRRKK